MLVFLSKTNTRTILHTLHHLLHLELQTLAEAEQTFQSCELQGSVSEERPFLDLFFF